MLFCREKEEDKEMADFLKSKFPQNIKKKGNKAKQKPLSFQAQSFFIPCPFYLALPLFYVFTFRCKVSQFLIKQKGKGEI